MSPKKSKNLSLLDQKSKNLPVFEDPDNLQEEYPVLLEAVKEVIEGSYPIVVARSHGIDIKKFQRFCKLNKVWAARSRNTLAQLAAIQNMIDMETVIANASPDTVLKWELEALKFQHAAQGGTTSRKEVAFSSPLDKYIASLSKEEREEALRQLSEEEAIDVEPEEE